MCCQELIRDNAGPFPNLMKVSSYLRTVHRSSYTGNEWFILAAHSDSWKFQSAAATILEPRLCMDQILTGGCRMKNVSERLAYADFSRVANRVTGDQLLLVLRLSTFPRITHGYPDLSVQPNFLYVFCVSTLRTLQLQNFEKRQPPLPVVTSSPPRLAPQLAPASLEGRAAQEEWRVA